MKILGPLGRDYTSGMKRAHLGLMAIVLGLVGCGAASSGDEDRAEEQINGTTNEPEPANSENGTEGEPEPEASTPNNEPDDDVNDTPVQVPEPEPTPVGQPTAEPGPLPTPSAVPCPDIWVDCDAQCPAGGSETFSGGCATGCDCAPLTEEPEPSSEPEPSEPEPSSEPEPCDELALCDLACPVGSAHPVKDNGCVDTCSCEPQMTPEPEPEPALCGKEGMACFGDSVVAIVAAPTHCCDGLRCVPDFCTDGVPSTCTFVCRGTATADPCNGECSDAQACVFQNGGPGPARYRCAEQTQPCDDEDNRCACIVEQGTCSPSETGTVCVCENGLD